MRSKATDTTALGVAVAAGLADGVNACDFRDEFRDKVIVHDTFLPTTTLEERNARYAKWKMAVERSLGWSVTKKSGVMTDERFRLLSSIPASLFLLGSFVMLVVSQIRR